MEKKRTFEFFWNEKVLCFCAVFLIIAFILSAFLVVFERKEMHAEIANLNAELAAKDQENNPTPSFITSREPEPVQDRPTLSATYRYQRITDIPSTLPGDASVLWFQVDEPCSKVQSGTILKTTVHSVLKTKLTIAVPNLEVLTDECAKYGYGLISILTENLDTGYASLSVFAFNPEENPFIEIFATGSGDFYASMDVQVFKMSFVSTDGTKQDAMYRCTGVSQSDFNFFGGSSSGNDDYTFDAFSVFKVDDDDWCNPLEWSLEDIQCYYKYWGEHHDLVMTRRQFFSNDRTTFYLLDYLKTAKNVVATHVSDSSIVLLRSDKSELVIERHSHSDNRGDYSTMTKDGEEYRYALAYHPRVNGLPTRICTDNGLPLSTNQVLLLLKFIENPATPY